LISFIADFQKPSILFEKNLTKLEATAGHLQRMKINEKIKQSKHIRLGFLHAVE
jgi:hypothetical protein